MKYRLLFGFLLSIIGLLSFKVYTLTEAGLVPDKKITHIGIVVKDIDKALDHWVTLLGYEKKPTILIAEGHHLNPTMYRGKPSNAKAKLAFLVLQNLQIELIEPIGSEKSHWREFLDLKGNGVHHVAFDVQYMEENYVSTFKENGYVMAQHGGWDGGEYGYMDGLDSLGVMIELIERHK
jgi:methylmalonyl-CoA/ethylmalonyl-CoA epimerase